MVILQLRFRIPSVEISSPIFIKLELLAYRVALQIKEVIDIGSFDQFGCAALLAISISFTILILAGSFHCG
jgi:hypothetical protein